MSLNDHPLRRWAVDEMHIRRFPSIPARCEIIQTVRLVSHALRSEEDRYLITDRPRFDEWQLATRHGLGRDKSGVSFVWERHTEASTITFVMPDAMPPGLRAPILSWIEAWPGDVVRATRIFVEPDRASAEERLSKMAMSAEDMVCCDVNCGVRLWSDFAIHGDGYGRLLLSAGTCGPGERGRIVQRLQELGNYRNLALLGFPLVQKLGPQVDAVEQSLAHQARMVAEQEQDDEVMIQRLAEISSELELVRSESSFRLSATKAYGDVAMDRLRSLEVKPVVNYQSLTEFTERRLVPASRTCLTFDRRLDRIAERTAGIMHTLNTRVDTRIKAQNLELTESMERSTHLQFRLQTLVEGLSVIAAAYYAVGLIGFLAKGVDGYAHGKFPEMVTGLVTLPVILGIYLLVRHLRHKVVNDNGKASKD